MRHKTDWWMPTEHITCKGMYDFIYDSFPSQLLPIHSLPFIDERGGIAVIVPFGTTHLYRHEPVPLGGAASESRIATRPAWSFLWAGNYIYKQDVVTTVVGIVKVLGDLHNALDPLGQRYAPAPIPPDTSGFAFPPPDFWG